MPLAAAGRDVVVADKAVFPRDKCCGDGLTTLALRELELLGFDPASVADWQVVDGAVLRSPSGREVRVPLPTGAGTYAAVAPRLQLDDALVDVAVKAGATVIQGHGFDGSITACGDHLEVGLDGHEPVAARYVVAADGMWSPVRKALGLGEPGYLGEWHAFRQYVGGVSGSCPRAPPRVVRRRPAPRLRAGRSRSPAGGPTSASACCVTAPGASRT